MSVAEKIREFYRDNPDTPRKEAALALDIDPVVLRASISRDVKQGKASYLESGGVDYSSYFNVKQANDELVAYKNQTRREMVELLLEAMRKETDGDKLWKLSKEIDRLLKEITE